MRRAQFSSPPSYIPDALWGAWPGRDAARKRNMLHAGVRKELMPAAQGSVCMGISNLWKGARCAATVMMPLQRSTRAAWATVRPACPQTRHERTGARRRRRCGRHGLGSGFLAGLRYGSLPGKRATGRNAGRGIGGPVVRGGLRGAGRRPRVRALGWPGGCLRRQRSVRKAEELVKARPFCKAWNQTRDSTKHAGSPREGAFWRRDLAL